jgi:arabinogalactan endo-1,4-beta-galactosidase
MTSTGIVSTSDWDVFGFSFYPFYGNSATFDNLKTSLNTLADRYRKPMMVVETDYPVLCDGRYQPIPDFSEPQIPVSVQGQLEWARNITQIVKNVKHGLGQGVFYWEPAWLNNTGLGSACEDAILFAQDFSNLSHTVGYSRPSINLFK